MHAEQDSTDERSLRDIAAWLTTPSSCGVFLSAADLRRIGQRVGIGVTPLNRRFAVEQLFRSAAIEDSADPLVTAFIEEILNHTAAYEACNSVHLDPWIDRCHDTVTTLQGMREEWLGSQST